MTQRYYVAEMPTNGGIIDLPAEEAAHAIRVMRVKPGDELTLFDGRNRQCSAVVVSQTKRDCQVDCTASEVVDREPKVDVTMAIALPKGDRSKFLVERLTEIGVTTITPLLANRSQGKLQSNASDKLTRIAIEACKQSGRNHLPLIEAPRTTTDFFSDTTNHQKFIAHPTRGIEPQRADLSSVDAASFRIAIGPEGGFTDEEVELAIRQGFQPIQLGKRIYRVETAAIVMATLAIHHQRLNVGS